MRKRKEIYITDTGKIKKKRLHLRGRLNRSVAGDVGVYIFIIALGLFMAFPITYAISNAFKPFDELFIFPPRFFVRNPTFDNFSDMVNIMSSSWVPFSRNIFNTFFVATVATVFHIIFASLGAFALAKYDFPGHKVIFNIIVLSLMFVGAVTAIPSYLTMAGIGWVDTYWAMIVPPIQSSLGLYLMKQFMETMIPDSLIEAARIDGKSDWGIFWTIVMPLVKPAWLTLTIFSIQANWNATGGVYIYSEELKTLPVALNQIVASGIARQGVGAAVSVFMMIVPVTIFIVSQNKIIETMATSGMKE